MDNLHPIKRHVVSTGDNSLIKQKHSAIAGGDIIDCDFSKTSIKNYYTIINLAKSLYDNDIGPGLSYDRNILGALFLKTTGYIENMVGYIQYIKRTENADNITMYIGNVFKDDLYISNHLVCEISNDHANEMNIEIGMFISFSGNINKYHNEGTKFGIKEIKINKVISNAHKNTVDILNNMDWSVFNFKQDIIAYPQHGEYKYCKWLMTKITNVTSRLPKEFPTEFYINMILSMHLSDRIEKYMVTFQSNHDYLIDNCTTLKLPLAALVFVLEELEIYDPFSVLSLLTHFYAGYMYKYFKLISAKNDMDPGDLNVYVQRNMVNIERVMNFNDNAIFNSRFTIADYSDYLLNQYHKNLID